MSSCAEAVLDYMRIQNRPFGVTNVTDALASAGFKKGQVQSALQSLAEKGDILAITNKAAVVYLVAQPEEVASPDELRALEHANATLDAQVKALKAQLVSLKGGAFPSVARALSELALPTHRFPPRRAAARAAPRARPTRGRAPPQRLAFVPPFGRRPGRAALWEGVSQL